MKVFGSTENVQFPFSEFVISRHCSSGRALVIVVVFCPPKIHMPLSDPRCGSTGVSMCMLTCFPSNALMTDGFRGGREGARREGRPVARNFDGVGVMPEVSWCRWAFSVWGLIFGLQGLGAIYQLLSGGYQDGSKKRIVNSIGKSTAYLTFF